MNILKTGLKNFLALALAAYLSVFVVMATAAPFSSSAAVVQPVSGTLLLALQVLWFAGFGLVFLALDLVLRRFKTHANAFLIGFGGTWAASTLSNAIGLGSTSISPAPIFVAISIFFLLGALIVYADLRRVSHRAPAGVLAT